MQVLICQAIPDGQLQIRPGILQLRIRIQCFNYAITYCKGSCVLHLLRYTLGDTLFFRGIKAYATDTANFKLKNATIPEFFAKMTSVSGQDLTWFYNAWLYQPNHPLYKILIISQTSAVDNGE